MTETKMPHDICERVADALESAGWRHGDGTYLEQDDKGWFTTVACPMRLSEEVEQFTLATFAYWPDHYDSFQAAQAAVGKADLGVNGFLLWPTGPAQFPPNDGAESSENYYHGTLEVSLFESDALGESGAGASSTRLGLVDGNGYGLGWYSTGGGYVEPVWFDDLDDATAAADELNKLAGDQRWTPTQKPPAGHGYYRVDGAGDSGATVTVIDDAPDGLHAQIEFPCGVSVGVPFEDAKSLWGKLGDAIRHVEQRQPSGH